VYIDGGGDTQSVFIAVAASQVVHRARRLMLRSCRITKPTDAPCRLTRGKLPVVRCPKLPGTRAKMPAKRSGKASPKAAQLIPVMAELSRSP